MNNFVKTYIMRQVDTVRVSEISNIGYEPAGLTVHPPPE